MFIAFSHRFLKIMAKKHIKVFFPNNKGNGYGGMPVDEFSKLSEETKAKGNKQRKLQFQRVLQPKREPGKTPKRLDSKVKNGQKKGDYIEIFAINCYHITFLQVELNKRVFLSERN